MKVALLTQWFPPERIRLPSIIASGLVELGHEVDVLTGFPNYPNGKVIAPYRQRPLLTERPEPGVTVHRTPLYPSHDASAARRVLNYLSWATTASVAASTRLPRPDVFLVYSSPVTASVPAIAASPLKKVPTALLLQDLWPDSVTGSGLAHGAMGRLLTNGAGTAAQYLYRQANSIGAISPGMTDVLTERGIPRDRIHYTPNWVDIQHLRASHRPSHQERADLGFQPGSRHFVYAGNIGRLQNLEPIVRAFAGVRGAQLTMVGDGVERHPLQTLSERLGADNVHFPGACRPEEVGKYLACADALVLSLDDTELLRVTMPSKVQTYLAAGRPILAHCSGDAADTVVRAGAGVQATPNDVTSIRQAVERMSQATQAELLAWGRAGSTHYADHLDRKHGLVRLESLLHSARGRE